MEIKVSVIIPVYNVEKYLERCLTSVCNQTFKEIEIICINDGSNDNSLEILENYQHIDPRIVIIDKKNEGLSKTRNLGIKQARGDYLTFVDSDDWIEESMIEELYNISVNHKADITLCLYNRCYENKKIPKILDLPEVTLYTSRDTKYKLFRKVIGPLGEELKSPENLDSLVTAWGKLYKTDLLRENNIIFIDTAEIGTEDLLFNVYALGKCEKSCILNKSLYNYWKGNSQSLTSSYKPNLELQWKRKRCYILQYLDLLNVEDIFYEALNNRICLSTLGLGINEFSITNKKSIVKKVMNYYRILSDEEVKLAFSNFQFKYLPIHWRIFYLFNKYRLSLLSYMMIILINILRRFI